MRATIVLRQVVFATVHTTSLLAASTCTVATVESWLDGATRFQALTPLSRVRVGCFVGRHVPPRTEVLTFCAFFHILMHLPGGKGNSASGPYSAVSGGAGGDAGGASSSVSGGRLGFAAGDFASVLGGALNIASGTLSTTLGGSETMAESDYEIAP